MLVFLPLLPPPIPISYRVPFSFPVRPSKPRSKADNVGTCHSAARFFPDHFIDSVYTRYGL